MGEAITSDHRSDAAKLRDAWFDSPEGIKCLDASTLPSKYTNYYLKNRLERAFIAGMQARATLAQLKSKPQ